MAKPLTYTPPPEPPGEEAFTAADDLARLVETLHTSGALRLLNGLLGRIDAVASVALDGMDTPAGRRGLANALILGKLLGQLDPDGLDRFVVALDRGLAEAGKRLGAPEEPPGALSTLRRLRDRDVRRGLDAVLTLLGTLGSELHAAAAAPPNGHATTPAAP